MGFYPRARSNGRSLAAAAALAVVCGVLESGAAADLFAEESVLELKLAAPLGTVFRSKADPEYHEATLAYRDAAGSDVTVPLRIRVRGKSRVVACSFPPLLLNFRTPELVGTALEGEDRLKLVTHCDSSDAFDNYVRLEYLAYQVLSLLTPHTLRARLVNVSYFDSGRERDLGTRPGILLEDEQRFGERQGWTPFEEPAVDRARYDAEALALIDVFQYLIGNTDWSALAASRGEEACCHNVVPYVRGDGKLVPVVYDFDSSGIVDPPYAAPDERLRIRDVRQRLYRGRCRTPEELAPIFARFEAQKSAIVALFDEREGLEPGVAARARDYIDDFFAVLADDERREKAFFAVCEN
jgi:hypothetical protein